MQLSNLRRSEVIGVIGSVVLVLSLFLPWFSLQTSGVIRGPEDWVCGVGNDSCTAFDTFSMLRWLLIAAAAAPLILAYLVATTTDTSYPRGEFTAVVGLTALVLILYNGFIDKPSDREIGISLAIGYYVGMLGSILIFVGGALSSLEAGGGAKRKPPATY